MAFSMAGTRRAHTPIRAWDSTRHSLSAKTSIRPRQILILICLLLPAVLFLRSTALLAGSDLRDIQTTTHFNCVPRSASLTDSRSLRLIRGRTHSTSLPTPIWEHRTVVTSATSCSPNGNTATLTSTFATASSSVICTSYRSATANAHLATLAECLTRLSVAGRLAALLLFHPETGSPY